ncbi:dephospho-CoA kinase [Pseudomonadota bacterium]
MLVIGLTGGIGSGKSTICNQFASLGTPIIDADLIAHELVEPGQPALGQIASAFGHDFITAQGELDRPRLREHIFIDETARARLQAILHPLIRARMKELLAALDAPYVIIAIPLLVETGQRDMLHRILVIDTPEELQIQRVCQRDKVSVNQVQSILEAQCSRSERLAVADDIIHNTNGLDALERQVNQMHQHYLKLAAIKDDC